MRILNLCTNQMQVLLNVNAVVKYCGRMTPSSMAMTVLRGGCQMTRATSTVLKNTLSAAGSSARACGAR